MKLIIEKSNGSVFIYRENEKHHKQGEKCRSDLNKIDWPFDNQCYVDYMDDDSYIVLNLGKNNNFNRKK